VTTFQIVGLIQGVNKEIIVKQVYISEIDLYKRHKISTESYIMAGSIFHAVSSTHLNINDLNVLTLKFDVECLTPLICIREFWG
jgi:ABC-type lipopolysaccharide export system ATPase subunit